MRLLAPRMLMVVLLAPAAGAGDDAGLVFFENEVRPLLAERCTKCHGEKRQRSGLRLDSRAAILAGGERGPAVVAGDPAASLLVRAVRRTDDDLAMPPRDELEPEEVDVLVRWVEAGAPGPDDAGEHRPGGFDLEARAEHWAFQPLADAPPPAVADAAWVRSPIDAFVRSRQEAAGVRPAPEAARRDWIRRVTFDLTGLPPTPDEVEAFVPDPSADAHARVVDRLLDSPRFAERWARHWLDLVGYAETRGHEFDYILPNAWQYRDWVIRAIDADVPYDRFVEEQIAGDLVDPPRLHPREGWNESILGTGFWAFGEEVHSPVSTRADRMDRVAGRIDTLSRGFLGLSVACARCHDHKFDAISARDFYALAGFAEGATYAQIRFETYEEDRAIGAALAALHDRAQEPVAAAAVDGFRAQAGSIADAVRVARALREAGFGDGAEELFEAERTPSAWLRVVRGRLRDELVARAAAAGVDPAVVAAWTSAEDELPSEVTVGVDVAGGKVHADYRAPDRTPLWQNGFSFRSTAAGDVALGDDARRPARRAAVLGAARFDPAWRVVEPHPESQGDPGGAGWMQAGVTLKTPTFTLSSGRLWLLVEGAGHVYAAVDKHRLIHGPLHGRLVASFGDAHGFRWVPLDLSPYSGHRVHLEFSPRLRGGGEEEFAVALVVEGDAAPALRRVDAEVRGPPADVAAAFRAAFAAFGAGRADARELALVDWWWTRRGRAFDAGGAATRVGQLVRERRAQAASIRPRSRLAPGVIDGSGVDEFLLTRGDVRTPAGAVPRRFLEAIDGPSPLALALGRTSGRLALAERLTSAANPLPARVLVNRVWHHLFGRGLAASVDDLGKMGEAPGHPLLLDWMARRFVDRGWSLKAIVREVALSSTYRMSSAPDDVAATADPTNRLWSRFPVRRLSAEAVRDAILAVAGTLDPSMYGPPVPIHLTRFLEGRGRPARSGPLDGAGRRSIYLSVRRNFLSPFLQAFDFPSPAQTMGRRSVSNVPAQALALMNDPFVVEQSQRWAARARAAGATDRALVDDLYRRAFGRPPTQEEAGAALAFLGGSRDEAALADLCHVLFNVKEFVFIR